MGIDGDWPATVPEGPIPIDPILFSLKQGVNVYFDNERKLKTSQVRKDSVINLKERQRKKKKSNE